MHTALHMAVLCTQVSLLFFAFIFYFYLFINKVYSAVLKVLFLQLFGY